MTSNNLEAIELLKTCVERLQEQGFSSYGNTVSELNEAIDLLLQADEVQGGYYIGDNGKRYWRSKKPTKETKLDKLKDLQDRIEDMEGRMVYTAGMSELLKILIEEEY